MDLTRKMALSTLAIMSLVTNLDLMAVPCTWTGAVIQEVSVAGNWSSLPTSLDNTIFSITTTETSNSPPYHPALQTASESIIYAGVDFQASTFFAITLDGTLTVNGTGITSTNPVSSEFAVGRFAGGGPDQSGTLITNGPAFNGTAGSSLLFALDFGGDMIVSGGGQTGAGLATITMLDNISTLDASSILTINTLPATFDSVSSSLASNLITIDSALTTGNASNQTIAGSIAGAGTFSKVGAGTLALSGNSSAFSGTTNINAGGLSLPTSTSSLGGTVNLTGGVLSGIGTIGSAGRTFTSSGGTIHPGNSPGILTVIGNHANSGAGLSIDIQGTGNVAGVNNGELVVQGTETITNSPTVTATSLTGTFSIAGPYTILNAIGGFVGSGQFNPIVNAIGTTIVPILTYDTNNVYLNYQIPFFNLAENNNELNVARQLASITSPSAAETTLLTNITSLAPADIVTALDELSGSQYVEIEGATEFLTQRFVRRLYDPVRVMISTVQQCGCPNNLPCGTAWVEGSGQRSFFDGDNRAHGFKASGYEISGGVQGMAYNDVLFGAAVTYDNEHYKFNIGGSSGKSQSVLGAVYALYRPETFYILGDLVFGGTYNKINRTFSVGPVIYNESGKPKTYEGMIYVEGGYDYVVDCGCVPLLIQPFLGLEGGFYYLKSFNESGTVPVALGFDGKKYGTFDTRLGAHFSINYPGDWLFALDLAWQYRWTGLQTRTVFFENFGSSFALQGSKINRNAFDGSVNITKQITDVWGVYVTATGQKWSNASSYNVIGGVTASW